MYCPNCGKLNSPEDAYCTECGSELIDNQNFPAFDFEHLWQKLRSGIGALYKKTRLFFNDHPKIALPIAALVGCFLLISILNATVFSGKSVARRYFKALMNNDSRAVYSCLDLPKSEFVNASAFDEFYKSLGYQARDVGNYKIVEKSSSDSALTLSYGITYYLRGESSTHSTSVQVVNSPLFFGLINRYKVLSGYVSSNFEILVPSGSSVAVDGIALSDPTAYEGYDRFSIPSLFCTEHTIEVSHPLGYAEESFIPSPGYGDSYTLSYVSYNSDTANAVYAQAQTQLNTILAAALARQQFPDGIVKYSGTSGNVDEAFASLQSDLYNTSDNTGFTRIEIQNTSDQSSQQAFDISEIRYDCTVEFDYSYDRRWQNYWSGETGTDTSTSYGQATFTYRYEDGVWALENIDIRL